MKNKVFLVLLMVLVSYQNKVKTSKLFNLITNEQQARIKLRLEKEIEQKEQEQQQQNDDLVSLEKKLLETDKNGENNLMRLKKQSLEVNNIQKYNTKLEDPKNFDPNKKFGVNVDKDGVELSREAKEKMEMEFRENIKGKEDQQKIEMYPNRFYWEYMQDKEELRIQSQRNRIAQDKFDRNSDGSDGHQNLIREGLMGVVVQYYGRYDNDANVHIYHMRLNEHSLYISQYEEQGYRGINASIQLQYLYDDKVDDVRMGQCCQSIGIVVPRLFGDHNSQYQMHCFQVDDMKEKQSWQICNNEQDESNDWRQFLILGVIKYGLSRFGIYGLDELLKFQKQACVRPRGWSYRFQSRWPCLCPEGTMQSPIDIDTKLVINNDIINMIPKYRDTRSIVTHIESWETYTSSEYGQLVYRNKKRQKSMWTATNVRFKFPAEHTVDGKQYPSEMQIVHNNGDTRLIVSLFITTNENDLSSEKTVATLKEKETKVDENVQSGMDLKALLSTNNDYMDLVNEARRKGDQFINSFKAGEWKDRSKIEFNVKDHEEFCINSFVNLDKIWGSKDTMTHSFYGYQGSDSEAPCNEDVFWIILKDRLLINQGAFDELEKKVMGGDIGQPNNRRIMPYKDREILSHNECRRFQYPGLFLGPPPDAQYVKAQVDEHYYAIIHPGSKTMFDQQPSGTKIKMGRGPQKLVFEKIDEQQMENISPQIRQDLRFQLGEWMVNNRNKIMLNQYLKRNQKYGVDQINGI